MKDKSTSSARRYGPALAVLLGTLAGNAAATHLVTATLPGTGAVFDGVAVANQLDEFYGYSTDLMTQLQTAGYMPTSYGSYDFATGTGGLDVLLYTGSGGVHGGNDNQGVGPGGAYNFEDPVHNPNGNATEFEGWWGQNDPTNSGDHTGPLHGPVTVGQVLDYLHAFDPHNNTPVFYADINQSGNLPGIQVAINAYIADPTTFLPIDTVNAAWGLDGGNDGTYDKNNPASIDSFSATGTSGTTYNVDIAKGSGKADFIFYAPTMDLTKFSRDMLFVMNGWIGSLNDGFEEFFLSGAIGADTHVPAPAPLWLLTAALAALGLRGYLRQINGVRRRDGEPDPAGLA